MQNVYIMSDLRTEKDFEAIYNDEQRTFYLPITTRLTKNCLLSLIGAFERNNFGLDTIPFFYEKLSKFKKDFIEPNNAKLFLDSGGCSYVNAKIDPLDTAKMIECFVDFLDCYSDSFDYVFSLGIPKNIKKKDEKFNSYDFIKKMIYKSFKESEEVLNKNKSLIDKFYLARYFETRSQYKIWSELYNDDRIGLKHLPVNHAIGGFVKTKKINELKYSPSIGMAYKCLFEYLNESVYKNKIFKLHFIGVNEPVERLTNSLIEALFNIYLKRENFPGAFFTYDTLNYSINNSQEIINMHVLKFEEKELIKYTSPLILPDNLIEDIYYEKEYANGIKQEIDFLKSGNHPANVHAFLPLRVYSNLQLDKYIEYVVNNELLKIFEYQSNVNYVRNYCEKIKEKEYVQHLKNDSVKKFTVRLKNNIEKIYDFHNWYLCDRSEVSLDNLLHKYAKK